MKILATDLFRARLDEAAKRHPAARATVQQRLRELVDDGVARQSKKLKGSPGFWSSRIHDDLRLLWQRGEYNGESAVYLITVGDHDHVFEEAKRIRPDGWADFALDDEVEADTPWRVVGSAPAPSNTRFSKLDASANAYELALTEEQELLADELLEGPMLLTGPAGCGKTTVLAHKAVRMASLFSHPMLIVTFHEPLALYTRGMIEELHGGLMAGQVHVRSFRELIDETWGLARPGTVAPYIDPEVLRARVNQAVQAHGLAGVPRAYIDAELRGALLGRWLPHGEMPTADEYAAGRRGDLTFLREPDRRRLHAAAREIARSMHSAGLVDNLTAARELSEWIDEGKLGAPERYLRDGLFIDEGQDFTEVELEFLARLVPDPARWTVAADELQVVHPSLFRWDRVRDSITRARDRLDPAGHAPRPRVQTRPITTNHRNPKPVLDLGLSVLQWRHALLGGDTPRAPGSWAEGALVPRVASYPHGEFPAEAIAAIAQRVPLTAVLCPTASLANDVRAAVGDYATHFSRAFEFGEAKGLEFDVVILVDAFAGPDGDALERRATRRDADLTPDGVVELAANKLYVAITRSKRALFAIESRPPHATWDVLRARPDGTPIPGVVETVAEVSELVTIVDAEFTHASPTRWIDAARQFERQGKWEAAIECWIQGDLPGNAGAIAEEKLERRGLAIKYYELGGCVTDVARCRALEAQEAGQWRVACEQFMLAGRPLDAERNEARALRAEGKPVEAAQLFEKIGEIDEAVETWLGAGIAEEAYRLAHADRPPEWRARLLSRLGRHAESATAWSETGRHQVNALDEALLDGGSATVLRHLRPVLELKEARRFIDARLDRLDGAARALAGRWLDDWQMEAEGYFDSGRFTDAIGLAEGRMRSSKAEDFREAARLARTWVLSGRGGLSPSAHARRALEAELRFVSEDRASPPFLAEAQAWALAAGIDFPGSDIAARIIEYRDVCKARGDRAALVSVLSSAREPVLVAMRHALGGDVALAREIWQREGYPALCFDSLNPMLFAEHFPALLSLYKQGHRLSADARERLLVNLQLCIKGGSTDAQRTWEGLRHELTGAPHVAWRILKDRQPELARVRHQPPTARRAKMEEYLSTAVSLPSADYRRAVELADCYRDSGGEDLSPLVHAVLEGRGFHEALAQLALLYPNGASQVVLPVRLSLLVELCRNPADLSPLGPSWRALAERTLETLPDTAPLRSVLLACLGQSGGPARGAAEAPEAPSIDDFRSEERKVAGLRRFTEDLADWKRDDQDTRDRWRAVLSTLVGAWGNTPPGRIAQLALRLVNGEKQAVKKVRDELGGAAAEFVRGWGV